MSRKRATPEKTPDHYKVICISMYTSDLAALDEKVAVLKERGLPRVSRSALIRYALSKVDPNLVPRGM